MEVRRGEPLLAIALALLSWVPLPVAVLMAVGDTAVTPIAICLIVAGALGLPGVALSVLGFARTRGAGQLLSALAFAIAGSLTGTIIVWVTALS
jgi:hypothetical protein